MKEFINRLALLESGKCAMLPVNRGNIGDSAFKSLVTELQSPMTEFKAFFKDFPEFIKVTLSRQCHIRKTNRDDTLID